MSKPKILLVEDEHHIAQGLIFNLEQEGFEVIHAATGEAALAAFARNSATLVVLDLMLPDMHGLEICRRIRLTDQRIPILILTALGEDKNRVEGLSDGADDYLSKPFNLDEFLLRIRGMLRRSAWYSPKMTTDQPYRFGGNQVDLSRQSAITANGKVSLTVLETRMLETFFAREGEIVERARLLESVWGLSADTETRSLDNFVVRLRKYFEPDPTRPVHFLTVRSKGYQFIKNPARHA